MTQALEKNATETTPPDSVPPTTPFWEGLRRGDRESMQHIWERITIVCPAILRRNRISAADQGDILQETFLSTHDYARRHVAAPLHLDAFLQWRARSVVGKQWRVKELQRRVEPLTSELQADHGSTVEASVVGEELSSLIERSVETWSPRARRIWELHYGVTMGIGEIASHLRMNRNTVATILFRARMRLNEDLQSVGFACRCA